MVLTHANFFKSQFKILKWKRNIHKSSKMKVCEIGTDTVYELGQFGIIVIQFWLVT